MKVNSATPVQQIKWQRIANEKQQKLKEATKGEALKRAHKEFQLKLYNQKGYQLKLQNNNNINIGV